MIKWTKLEDCCEILDYKRIPVAASQRRKGPYPYYGANGVQDYVDDYIFNDDLVLLAEDGGNFGSKNKPIAYRVSGKCWVNNHAHVLKPKMGIDIDYLCYSLAYYNVDNLINGATRKKLTQNAMRQLKIPVLPLNIQKRIVNKIQNIEKIINLRKKEINQLNYLIKARFVEMFGDPVINNKNIKNQKLGDVCFLKAGEFTSSKTISPVKTSINKYPCFGGNGIRGYVNNYTHQGNYSLIGRQGALCGNVKFATGKFRNTEHAILASPKIEINSRWLFELLNLEKLNRFKSGAAQPGLAVKTLNEVTIPVADLKLQNEFANFVQQVDKSKFENIVYLNKTLSSKILSQIGDVIRD